MEVREGFAVGDLVVEDGRVAGIRGVSGITERARVVIGADGLHSLVARRVGAAVHHATRSLTCAYYGYWSGVPVDALEVHRGDGRMCTTFPTNDGLTVLYAAWRSTEFARVRADVEGHLLDSIVHFPRLAETMRGGGLVERIRGTGDLPNLLRTPRGAGWALVGDAGRHQDPNTAWGITDAFADAELLAAALDAAFSGRHDLGDALAWYERERDRLAMPGYELTRDLATLAPLSAEMREILGALQDDQWQVDRFFGAHQGTVPIREFLTAGNLRRIAGAAPREGDACRLTPPRERRPRTACGLALSC